MNDEEIKQENKTEPLDEDNLDQGIGLKKFLFCEETFSQKGHLKNHMSSVHLKFEKGIKKYKCDTCKKLFATKQTLDNHKEMVHEGLKKSSNGFVKPKSSEKKEKKSKRAVKKKKSHEIKSSNGFVKPKSSEKKV